MRKARFASVEDTTGRLNRGENVGILAKNDVFFHEIDPKSRVFIRFFAAKKRRYARHNQSAHIR
jgi:hypothetical protein